MDGIARSARRAALVSVACASILFACILVWNLMPGGSLGGVATWTLAAVLALVLLPIASLVAWEVDRRAAARAAKQDLDRALRDWAALMSMEPKTGAFSAAGSDPTPSRAWSSRDESRVPVALEAKGATMSAAPEPRELLRSESDLRVERPGATASKPEAKVESKTDVRAEASRVREPAPTPRRVHPHRRAARNR
ncbi:MAG: hypothetical protein SFY96_11360 [Planctomycetota bacterium]|nr:hypothetical protein [Planctomycetota bacterium]